MGVAGSGKTTVGALLALELGWDFYDGDDFHSDANRAKMSQRIPLNDEDRSTWLAALRYLINQNLSENRSIVLACSALKESYRHMLKVNEQVHFVHLQGSYQQIEERLRALGAKALVLPRVPGVVHHQGSVNRRSDERGNGAGQVGTLTEPSGAGATHGLPSGAGTT